MFVEQPLASPGSANNDSYRQNSALHILLLFGPLFLSWSFWPIWITLQYKAIDLYLIPQTRLEGKYNLSTLTQSRLKEPDGDPKLKLRWNRTKHKLDPKELFIILYSLSLMVFFLKPSLSFNINVRVQHVQKVVQ